MCRLHGPGRGDPVPGGEDQARAAQAGFPNPWPFTSLAGGRTGLICRLIVLLPRGTAAKRPPGSPGCRDTVSSRPPAGWREDQDSSRCQR